MTDLNYGRLPPLGALANAGKVVAVNGSGNNYTLIEPGEAGIPDTSFQLVDTLPADGDMNILRVGLNGNCLIHTSNRVRRDY